MSRVRQRDTDLELILRRALWAAGLQYRVTNALPGRPDVVFRGKRVAVFVDGCFWHGCRRHGTRPKTNVAFWRLKIRDNRARDERVDRQLKELGWTVIRLWGHQVSESPAQCVSLIAKVLELKVGETSGSRL